jgi:hypothetical protein
MPLAYVSPKLSYAIFVAVALMYCFPETRVGKRVDGEI